MLTRLFTALMVTCALACLACSLGSCGSPGTGSCSDGFIPDGAACAKCDPTDPHACAPGLVCCGQCRGTPFPPDFGPLTGNCTGSCPNIQCP